MREHGNRWGVGARECTATYVGGRSVAEDVAIIHEILQLSYCMAVQEDKD